MRVENIQFNNYNTYSSMPKMKAHSEVCNNTRQLDTSIYKSKGANVSFGIWVKGANKIEEDCIVAIRKAHEKRCRKYTEFDLQDFLAILREGHDKHDPRELIRATFEVFADAEDLTSKRRPEPKTLAAVLKLTKDMDEHESYNFLDFVSHELNALAVEPVVPLAKLPQKEQEILLPYIQRIGDIDFDIFANQKSAIRHTSDLYETFRCLIYAAQDAPIANAEQKLEYLSTVRADLQMYKRSREDFVSDKAHKTVVDIASDMYETVQDIILK